MTKIIEIEDLIQSGKRKRRIAERRREMAPLLHFLQCSRCQMKCWRCGSQSEIEPPERDPESIPFNLCKDCRGDYIEYQRSQQEEETEDILWRNREWKRMWEKWIEYQSAVHHFCRSKEVRELFEDLRG